MKQKPSTLPTKNSDILEQGDELEKKHKALEEVRAHKMDISAVLADLDADNGSDAASSQDEQ